MVALIQHTIRTCLTGQQEDADTTDCWLDYLPTSVPSPAHRSCGTRTV